jgi:hypothetical protein
MCRMVCAAMRADAMVDFKAAWEHGKKIRVGYGAGLCSM